MMNLIESLPKRKKNSLANKKLGYSREEAVQEFLEVQESIVNNYKFSFMSLLF